MINQWHYKKIELFQRYAENPIITVENWPYPVNAVSNPGSIRLASGDTVLLATVENRRGASFLNAIRSEDGVSKWHIEKKPALTPDPFKFPEEMWGISSPRIVYLRELGQFAITYTAFSDSGPCISLATTKDFLSFKKYGKITPAPDKDACIFPRQVNGRWLLLHQPAVNHQQGLLNEANICLSYSEDLSTWYGTTQLIKARLGSWWDASKIGLCTPPVETPEGWLVFYHGIRHTAAGCIYRIGVALLDLDDPGQVLYRSDEWILGPKAFYELAGYVNNVIFPCGFVLDEKSSDIRLYYGAAGSSIAFATGNIVCIIDWLKKNTGNSIAS